MSKYISIKIPNKDCKGIYLFADTSLKIITDSKEANKLIDDDIFKLQLQVRVEGIRGKKVFTFNKKQKSFIKAVEYVASQRDEVRATLKVNGTLAKEKTINSNYTSDERNVITFLERAEQFIAIKDISSRLSTIQNYSTALLTHAKPLHDKSINEIKIDDIQEIINEFLLTKAPGTVALFARLLRTFFRKQKADIIKDWDELSLPEVDNKVDYTLSLDDTKKIIAVMRNYSGTLVGNEIFYQYEEIKNIFTFLLTGRRINEVLELRYSDLNLETNSFTIPSTIAKGKKELTFNLDSYLIQAIESQARLNNIDLSKSLPKRRIFKYTKETPRIHFQAMLRSLGLPVLRLHDIRHMLASTLVQNKVPIADISVMLGHSSIAITEQRYASKSKDQASRATDALNDIINK